MHHEMERLVGLYDLGSLSRRQLLQALFALSVGPYLAGPPGGSLVEQGPTGPLFQTRTLNHVTLYASSVARSKAFYQRLTGLPIQAEDKDFCEFRMESGFLGIYAPDARQQPGFNHFCFGTDAYDPQAAITALKTAMPEAKPVLENQDQVYVQDPDGVRVQLADVRYKR
ncbi:MAG TPA: VOC family protein [Gemmatimonadales bacterium]|nr:VOC family protein [Gemmatimonadales bacterium]